MHVEMKRNLQESSCPTWVSGMEAPTCHRDVMSSLALLQETKLIVRAGKCTWCQEESNNLRIIHILLLYGLDTFNKSSFWSRVFSSVKGT